MGKIQIPKMDETAALDGLRRFAELVGRYPKTLSPVEIMQDKEFMTAVQSAHPEWKGLDEKMESGSAENQQQFIQMIMNEMMPIQMLGMFYMKLVQENKDPVYYGDQVAPGDSGAVLLRWKLDDTTYKVIYGDLTTAEMTFEQLQQIEPAPAQEPPTL